MGSLGSLGDGPEHHATISPRTPPGLTARPRGSSVDNVIPGTPPRSLPSTQEVPATPPSRRPLARVNSPTGVGGMAALMTASEQVQNTDVVSLVNAGRIVEAAQAAGTVYGPPPPPPAPYMDRLARYNSDGFEGQGHEAFSQLRTESPRNVTLCGKALAHEEGHGALAAGLPRATRSTTCREFLAALPACRLARGPEFSQGAPAHGRAKAEGAREAAARRGGGRRGASRDARTPTHVADDELLMTSPRRHRRRRPLPSTVRMTTMMMTPHPRPIRG